MSSNEEKSITIVDPPKMATVNASIDISFQVDPVAFGADPKKAIEEAIAKGMYELEDHLEIAGASVRELYEQGTPFTNKYIWHHGVPMSSTGFELSLSNEVVKQMKPIKEEQS